VNDLQTAYRASAPTEVTFSARVTSSPRYFMGRRTHCEHEAFDVQTSAGPLRVIDNVGLAPPVPVRPGDAIEVRGEMVHDRGASPIVHWTHHDPAGRHTGGFIELHGRTYA